MAGRLRRGGPASAGLSPRARIGLALLVALTLAVVVPTSVAGIYRDRRPMVALAWTPADAAARADLAANIAGARTSEEGPRAARALARDAIRRSPLSPVALRALGLAAADGEPGRRDAALLMAQSERLSRRDLPTHIWLIEYHLRRDEIAAAMRQFDVALRTTASSRSVLFPLLANASSDPRISRELMARMQRDPDWSQPFLAYLAVEGPDPRRAAQFAREFLDPADEEEHEIIRNLLVRLGSAGEVALAWELYTHFRLAAPGGGARGVANSGFEHGGGYVPFAWSFTEEGDLWAARQTAPDGRSAQVLGLIAHSGRAGVVAQQVLRLAPGAYRLRARVGGVPADPFERPEVRLRCVNDSPESALLALRPGTAGAVAQSIVGRFSIPSSCRFQLLAISVAGDGPPTDSLTWIDDIEVSSERGR